MSIEERTAEVQRDLEQAAPRKSKIVYRDRKIPLDARGDTLQRAVPETDGRSLFDYLEVPFVHLRLIVGIFFLSLLAATVALIVWPRSYESEAKLVIQVGRESVALDPTATTSQTLMLQKTQEEEVNSALEVLSSRQVAELVVDQIGPEPILEGVLPSSSDEAKEKHFWRDLLENLKDSATDGADQVLLAIGVKDKISSRERAIRKITNHVNIYAPKKSTAVTIHAEAKTPELAQAIAAAMTEGFLNRHLTVSHTEGSYEFFEEQSVGTESQLRELLKQRSDFMQQFKIVSTEDKRRILTDQLGSVEASIFANRGDYEQVMAEIGDLIAKANATESEIVSEKEEQTDQTWSGMRQRVYELELLEKEYSARYFEDNPNLINVREQLEGAKQILQTMSQDSTATRKTPNPVRLRIEEDLQKLQTRAVGLRSILSESERQREEINAEIDKLLDFELKLADMNREVDHVAASLSLLKSKLEEARVIDDLQSDQISNVSVYQPASFVERPISPSKPLIALGLPLIGLLSGLGLALVREANRRTLRTSGHVQESVGQRVLASLPYSRKIRRAKPGASKSVRLLDVQCQEILSEIMLARSADTAIRGCTIGVIGVEGACGASTVAASLAVTSSEACGLDTLLIDTDRQDRRISSAFCDTEMPGLAELLNGAASEQECVCATDIPGLSVLSVASENWKGPLSFCGQQLGSQLTELQLDHDIVILDLPPASRPDRVNSIVEQLDYVLIVIESEKTEDAQAKRLINRLVTNKTPIGIVLNKTRSYVPSFVANFFS